MRTRFFYLTLLLAYATIIPVFAESVSKNSKSIKQKGVNAITKEAITGQVEFLASDWMQGRNTGEKGAYMASDYIVSLFKTYGVSPYKPKVAPKAAYNYRWRRKSDKKDNRSYYQNFNLYKYTQGEEQSLKLTHKNSKSNRTLSYKINVDYTVYQPQIGIEQEAEVVFVGYGYINNELKYNDLKGVDIKGKYLLCINGYPGHKNKESESFKKISEFRKSKKRAKSLYELAEKEGAAGIIRYSENIDISKRWHKNNKFYYKSRNYEGNEPLFDRSYKMAAVSQKNVNNIPYIEITERLINDISNGKIDIEKYEKVAEVEFKSKLPKIKNTYIKLKTSVEGELINVRNVLGVIEGENPNEYVIVGAHYDHLGESKGVVFNGADDNASGTVGMMTIAKACMATGVKPKRTIIFAGWTAEEKGLKGSRHFVNSGELEGKNVFAYLNLDMIARNSKKDTLGIKCGFTYTSTKPEFEKISESHIKDFDLKLELKYRSRPKPYGGSDFSSFVSKDIPIMSMMATLHEDYHTPFDETKKLDFNKMLNITKLAFLNIWELAN